MITTLRTVTSGCTMCGSEYSQLQRRLLRDAEISRREQCEVCGARDPRVIRDAPFGENNRVCRNCSASWYLNNCWKCDIGISGSRCIAACDVCKWYICQKPSCVACRQGGGPQA